MECCEECEVGRGGRGADQVSLGHKLGVKSLAKRDVKWEVRQQEREYRLGKPTVWCGPSRPFSSQLTNHSADYSP